MGLEEQPVLLRTELLQPGYELLILCAGITAKHYCGGLQLVDRTPAYVLPSCLLGSHLVCKGFEVMYRPTAHAATSTETKPRLKQMESVWKVT